MAPVTLYRFRFNKLAAIPQLALVVFPYGCHFMGEADSKALNNMDTDHDSKINFEVFKKTISGEIESADSLDEIKARLKSQQSVQSVELSDYLLKSNPPQRDFIVEFKTDDGVKTTKIVNIYDLGNQKYKLNKLRNE